MELMPNWWRCQLAAVIHDTLVDREKRRRKYQGRSPQLDYRPQLVRWLTSIAERHKLSLTSLHLSVYLLDHFMDNFDVSPTQLNLLAMGCLSVATKYEEKEEDIPKQNVMSHYCRGAYVPADFLKMELMLLKFFDWEVGLVTPAHFINYYVNFGCPELDNESPRSPAEMTSWRGRFDSLKSYARYFMSVCVQYHQFHLYAPSTIAAAAVAASRSCLDLIPICPAPLHAASTFSESDLLACQRDLLLIHDREKIRGSDEEKTSLPETSTPDGTPEGGHASASLYRKHERTDDSLYHSDELSDFEVDSEESRRLSKNPGPARRRAPRRRSEGEDKGEASKAARFRWPSCSPIPGHRQTVIGDFGPEAIFVHEGSSVAHTVEIEMEPEEPPPPPPSASSQERDAFANSPSPCSAHERAQPDTTPPPIAVAEVEVEDEDVVMIDADASGVAWTNDSGVGIANEDFAAEEECYDQGEVSLTELPPSGEGPSDSEDVADPTRSSEGNDGRSSMELGIRIKNGSGIAYRFSIS